MSIAFGVTRSAGGNVTTAPLLAHQRATSILFDCAFLAPSTAREIGRATVDLRPDLRLVCPYERGPKRFARSAAIAVRPDPACSATGT